MEYECLTEWAEQAFQNRRAAGLALTNDAEALAKACHDMARRFHRGGKLIAFGNGASSADAQHLAVEFVHPVIVGKRALPAISLTNDIATITGLADRDGWDEIFAHQLSYLANPEDIAFGLSQDYRGGSVRNGLAAAKQMGLLTISLTGGAATGDPADHVLQVHSDEPEIVKEVQVTMYHILWELVHVFLEQPGALV